MNIFFFLLIIITFSFILRLFYVFQRKIFERGYYSFYELITGLPPRLSFAQLFFIRFLPPFIITFIAYKLFNSIFNYHFMTYSFIGFFAALINIIPSLIDIYNYKGNNKNKLFMKKRINAIYILYFWYLLSFSVFSGFGGYLSAIDATSSLEKMLPSEQGLIDGLWGTLIIAILTKLNKPL